jgi:hypothetical protein
MRWCPIWLAVGAYGLLQGAACNVLESHSCSEIGCAGGVSIGITHSGAWPPGTYQLAITLDDVSGDCDLAIPDDLSIRSSVASYSCLDGLD